MNITNSIQRASHYCSHCGRHYTAVHQLDTHQRKCKRAKAHLKQLLGDTRAFWEKRQHERARARERAQRPAIDGGMDASAQDEGRDEPMAIDDAHQGPEDVHAPNDAQMDPQPEPEPPQNLDVPIGQRKGPRQRRCPKRYRDDEPEAPRRERRPAQIADTEPPSAAPAAAASYRPLVVRVTVPDRFGTTKSYSEPEPEPEPEAEPPRPPEELGKDERLDGTNGTSRSTKDIDFGPLLNESAFRLAEWYWRSPTKSFRDFQSLMKILKSPTFDAIGIANVNWASTFKTLGCNADGAVSDCGSAIFNDSWKCTDVSFNVPFHRQLKDSGVKSYSAGKFHHRPLVSVIKEKLTDEEECRHFQYQPYEERWKRNDESPEVEVFGELYGSRAFRQANDVIQAMPPTDRNRGLERVIVALMFWSDSTHLTSFGNATLWPCYLFFGNDSKFQRYKYSEGLGRQVAYFIKLPSDFNDYLKERNGGKVPKKELRAQCARELFHAQWSILLDQELTDAMKDGLILDSPDGKRRCFYPRVFTYSADYPERMLIAGVRSNGSYPCHRCLIEKPYLDKLGAPNDTERVDKLRCETKQAALVAQAQKTIEEGFAFDGAKIEADLFPLSLHPVENAIQKALSPFQFALIPSLVADQMHEFEIGVWKNLFIHLIRILHACPAQDDKTLWAELDSRYRQTPTFGRDTIRKFGVNASEMKRKAARDYEDVLQCAIPAFESLLPAPHNDILLSLLYICAQWHALAKLRSHNDFTLGLLEYTTVRLGAQMRLFNRDTCSKFETKELRKEAEARARREAKNNKIKQGSSSQRKTSLGVFTIKFHLLGDYCSIIRMFGTTDSYSTELGESFHRTPKSWYPRTDRKGYENQFAQIERRLARLSHIRTQIDGQSGSSSESRSDAASVRPGKGPGGTTQPQNARYSIGMNQNSPLPLSFFQDTKDPGCRRSYFTNFAPKLKQHLLIRILDLLGYPAGAETHCDWTKVVLSGDRLYSHKIMKVKYTTYDQRRDEDVIHVDTPQCNVMFLNGLFNLEPDNKEPPYLYGKVLGILHANVSFVGILPDGKVDYTSHRIDIGWIHWYNSLSFAEEFKLDRIALARLDNEEAIGFVDPSDILRGVHVIPRFSLGLSKTLTPPNELVRKAELWNEYYVNRFADRDSFMRYQFGMSVGHRYMHGVDFPSASIPTLPPDFDHCGDHEAQIQARIQGLISASGSGSTSEGSHTSPSASASERPEITGDADRRPEREGAPVPSTSGLPTSNDPADVAMGGDGPNQSIEMIEPLDSDDDASDCDEEIEYFVDQNDWEIDAYNDMYGDDDVPL